MHNTIAAHVPYDGAPPCHHPQEGGLPMGLMLGRSALRGVAVPNIGLRLAETLQNT